MSEVAIGEASSGERTFKRATVLAVVAIGAAAFIAMLVLGAYAPDLRSGKNGGAHALSNAASGFSGLVSLADATGRNPAILRSESELEREDLLIITPEAASTPLGDLFQRRGARLTLIVFPKWQTVGDRKHPGWVRIRGVLPAYEPEGVLAPAQKFKIGRSKERGTALRTVHPAATHDFGFVASEVTQFISGPGIDPVIVDQKGRVVLAKVAKSQLYVLADPDLLNNHGMADAKQAAAALALLDFLNSTDAESILFDVTANGLGRSRSPLKLAFDPPFTAVTLIIFVALLLAGWQAAMRFGSPKRPQRAIAFGKVALVDNSAVLIRKAGREAQMAPRFVDLIRERAAAAFNLPLSLKGPELDERLDALSSMTRFSDLAAEANSVRHRDEMLVSARKLNHWLEEVTE